MKYQLTYSIDHESLPEGKRTETMIEGASLSAVVKRLKVSGRQACELKAKLETSWTDPHGGFHVMELKRVDAA